MFNSKYLGIVSLWAVAECGLGGVMHALKIPFTGIFVGSISVMCLYFISQYSEDKKSAIIEATFTVLMIKLLASPQSPWQAYIAVLFQAVMALVLLTGNTISKSKLFFFALITQIESAVQRVAVMVLLFGTSFFKALDKTISQLLQWLGIPFEKSVVWPVFGTYVLLHVVTGVILGLWLPKLNEEVKNIKPQITNDEFLPQAKKRYSKFWITMMVSLCLPLILALILIDLSLLYVFIRALLITIVFIFVLTPILKYFIKKYSSKANNQNVQLILNQLPDLINHYGSHIKWAMTNYTGFKKMKYILVALLYASLHYTKDHE